MSNKSVLEVIDEGRDPVELQSLSPGSVFRVPVTQGMIGVFTALKVGDFQLFIRASQPISDAQNYEIGVYDLHHNEYTVFNEKTPVYPVKSAKLVIER